MEKPIREILGAPLPKSQLELENIELKAAMVRARTFTDYKAYPCPLCHYVEGVFIESCSMHKQITNLEEEIERLKKDADELARLKGNMPKQTWRIEYEIFPTRAIHWEDVEATCQEEAVFILWKSHVPTVTIRKISLKRADC